MSRPRSGRPPWLRLDEQERLLAETALYLRADAAYRLALGAGLACSEIAALVVGDIAADGRSIRDKLLASVLDRRRRDRGEAVEIPLPSRLQRTLGRYLAWRRGRCAHVERPMRSVRGRDGVPRCATCGEVADFLKAPLFVSRLGSAVTADRLRREFAAFRDTLGLRPWLHFDVLRKTALAGKAVGQ